MEFNILIALSAALAVVFLMVLYAIYWCYTLQVKQNTIINDVITVDENLKMFCDEVRGVVEKEE